MFDVGLTNFEHVLSEAKHKSFVTNFSECLFFMEKASMCHFEDLQMILFREVWIVFSIYMHLYRSGNVDDNLQQIYVH